MTDTNDRHLAEHDAVLLECIQREQVVEGGFAAMLLHQRAAGKLLTPEAEEAMRHAFFAGAHHVLASLERVPSDRISPLLLSIRNETERYFEPYLEEHAREVAAFDATYRTYRGTH